MGIKIFYTADLHLGMRFAGSNRDRHPFFYQEKESYLTIHRDTSYFLK
ncbi:MAG TPA: hypothetical protein VFD10_03120 [Atribacterota bacterium]|nr:hypothetical protein [Atribacterota bacterium]